MARALLQIPLILGIVFRLADADASTVHWRQGSEPQVQLCNFNEGARTYNITDLLLCMDELAKIILLQQNESQNRVSNHVQEDTRQSYPVNAFPDYSIPTNGVASSNHYPPNAISSLLSGGLPSLPNLFGFNSFSRPGFNLFNALYSIARYDDLKCIPRILCEVASGSIPGSYGYRQSTAFQDSGIATFFRLFNVFDIGSSPIIAFGRAALIGYTHRGNSYWCYREYPRCPQNPDQLISYLNTHNGGFFRFFNSFNNNYFNNNYFNNNYRPPQSFYSTYPKNSDVENKNVQPSIEHVPFHTIDAEPIPTETGKITFVKSNDHLQKNSDTHIFPIKQRESDSGKIIFPKNKRESRPEFHRIAKSHNVSKD